MITRRNLLGTAAAATAATGLAAPAVRAAGADVLKFASAASGPRTADPNRTTQGADNWHCAQIFEYLARPADGDFGKKPDDFEPALATSWKTSADGRTWSFALRRGVQFHKGYGEMTADDVVHSFMRAKAGGTAVSNYANVTAVKASGKYDVEITLKNPDPMFLGSVIFTKNVMVVSKKAEAEKGAKFGTDPIGTGPYQLDSFEIQKGVFLSRHPQYWGTPGRMAKLQCLYIADSTARTLALLSGDIDMMEAVRAPGWIQQVQGRKSGVHFDMTAPGSFNTLFFNLSKPPLDRLEVRQAIAHAIDTTAIVRALAPMSRETYTLNPPNYPTGFAHDDLPADLRLDYDPAKAKALLKAAGFPNGFRINANASQRPDYRSQYLIIQELLRKVGIDVNLTIMDHTAYHDADHHNLNTLTINSSSLPPVPLYVYDLYAASGANMKDDGKGGQNYSHYGVLMPGVDDLLAQMLRTTSFDDYVKVGRQVELKIQKDLPMMGLPTLSYTVARAPNVDLGYEVKGGYAYWSFAKATITG